MAGHKKKIPELSSALQIKTQNMTKRSLKAGCPPIEALAECQQLALELGTRLEQTMTDCEALVSQLEDYCELLYQLSIAPEDFVFRKTLTKKLNKLLSQVGTALLQNPPEEKKEIVFLPYKASMWDSMESIWQAAVQDPRCEAYVVPIPYFDRNQDGTLGSLHDEAGKYPAEVPVLSWNEFSLEKHRPDLIYIHNPYDQYNYVTSVHPAFYASRLKNLTDKLVYIPYFTAFDSEVPEHFAALPGVLYADRVIVQSEKARRIYIQALHEFEQKNHCENRFGKAEEKILALGSPKYDRILTAKKEDFPLPEAWQLLLYD